MKRILSVLSAIAALGCFAGAQTPSPTPMPPDDVVKISTNLIQVDVTVTDKKGKPVRDLRQDEIEIFENGVKQPITNFSFISAQRTAGPRSTPSPNNAIPPPPTQMLRPEQIRRTVALIVDDLSLSFESAYRTRRALKKFVDEQMQEGDLVAILRTGAGIGALQQFTADKRMLYAAIERVKWNPLGSGGVGVFAPLTSRAEIEAETDTEEDVAETPDEDAERQVNNYRDTYSAVGTLGALGYIIRGMADLPGRKAVILFSDGFQMFTVDANGTNLPADVLDPMRRLTEAANRASVVIYTIDPRGLVTTGLSAADDTGGRSAEDVDASLAERRESLGDSQDSLRYLAEETGGLAVINNNDMTGGIRRVLEDQSYYLIGYDPGEETFDAAKRRFNAIQVKVSRPGVDVRYRSGFFNIADSNRPSGSRIPATGTGADQLQMALTSPFGVSGISMRLNALFGNEAKGSFVRSLLHLNAAELKFTDDKDNTKKAVIEILAMSFGDNGQVMDQLAKSYTILLPPDAYKSALADGFVYRFAFPVKKPGAYQYRVAIRDVQGGRLGSASQFIEIPDLKKARPVISSIILENLSSDEWRRMSTAGERPITSNAAADTALRKAVTNSVLRYGFEIYSAKLNGERRPSLSYRIRIFRDNNMILDGRETAIDAAGQTDLARVKAGGALAIGRTMQPGDYVLQVIVTDRNRTAKRQVATQFVQFEVVE